MNPGSKDDRAYYNFKRESKLDLQLVIMAAGMGSRYGGLKQIDEFGPGRAFLMDYAIYDAYRLGVRKVTLVVRDHFLDQIRNLLQSKWSQYSDLKFNFVCQDGADLPAGFKKPEAREKPWGTSHVLFSLRHTVKGPFMIMNADDFYGRAGIRDLTAFMLKNPGQQALAAYPLQQTLSPHGPVTRGVCEITGGKLVSIDEVSKIFPDDPRKSYVSMNLWGFTDEIFALNEKALAAFLTANSGSLTAEYQIPHMINDLLKSRAVMVTAVPVDSPWFGVTHREDKEIVQAKIAALVHDHVYPENLFDRAAGSR